MAYNNNKNRNGDDRGESPVGFKDGEPVFAQARDGQSRGTQSRGGQSRGNGGYKKSYGDKKPYGEKSYGDRKPYGEKSYGDKSYGDRKPYGEKSYGDKKPYGEKSYGDKKPYGEKSYGDRKPYGEKSYGDKKPYGEKSYGDKKPYGEKSYGDKKPYGDRKPYGEKSYGDKKPYGEKSYGDKKPYGEKSYGDRKPYGEKSYGDKKPYGDKSYGDRKPYGEKSYGEKKPYGKKDDGFKPRYDNKQADEKPAQSAETEADELPYIIIGRNAVREAIKSGRSIDRILVTPEPDGSLREIINLARDKNVQLRETDKSKLDELCMPFGHGGKTANHQGIVAQVPGVEYCDISDILDVAKERGEKPFIILLDGIEDPHNLGSIIRSAECAGAHGVIIPRRRSATVTAAASKASAGAVEYMKVCRVANMAGAIDRLKDERLWVAGADMSGEPMGKAKLEGAIALVIGSEGDGISHLVKEKCDFLVSIPMGGHIDSLNASVAAAILMFEKRRQDSK